jgi:hypothetical protein
MVLQSEKSECDIFHIGFFQNRTVCFVPSPLASALCPLPETMVRLFVDDGVDQFSPPYQRGAANASRTWFARLFKYRPPKRLEAA